MRAALAAALLCAGCWNWDSLATLYQGDLAEGRHDLAAGHDLRGADLRVVDLPDGGDDLAP